jgi:hypothetical protein
MSLKFEVSIGSARNDVELTLAGGVHWVSLKRAKLLITSVSKRQLPLC